MSDLYNDAKHNLGETDLDLTAGTFKVLLLGSGYSFDADHDVVDDLTPGTNEVSGTGYSRTTLTNVTWTKDDTNDRAVFDADNVVYASINAGDVYSAVIYKEVTDDSDSVLIAFVNQGGFPTTTDGGEFKVQWSSDGIFYI